MLNKYIKKLTVILTLAIIVVSFNGCSQTNNSKSIVIWSHFGDKENYVLRSLAEKWGKQNGLNVKILSDRGDSRAYMEAEKAKIGPDIEFGMSYTKLNLLNKKGLLAPIPQNLNVNNYMKTAMNSVTIDGKLVGLPIDISTYALYYNTKKIAKAPETLEELIDLSVKNGFEYDINDIYLSYSFIASQGGYVFKYNDGKYDINDIGLNNTGAVKGYALLQDMVSKYKFIPKDVDGIKARTDFLQGKTAFYFNGPGDIDLFNAANLDYAVATLPTENGKNIPTFIGSDSAFVSNASNKKQQSFELIKYLIDECQIPFFKINGRLPVTVTASKDKLFAENIKLKAFVEQAQKSGVLIPDSNYIESFQTSRPVLKDLTEGKRTPESCGATLLKALKEQMNKNND